MSDLADTKKRMGQEIKTAFSGMEVPGQQSKTVTKMRLEAKLSSGADLAVACAEVKGGRPSGAYGLYWLFALSGGIIYDTMEACGLSAHPSLTTPLVFSCTSHNLRTASHFEVSGDAEFYAVAAAICKDIRDRAFPVIEGFDSKFDRGLDYILRRGPGLLRNPFTTCVILMNLAGRVERLEEIIQVASTAQGFYDFKGAADARGRIVQPLAQWFKSRA